jgi:ferredoxin
MRIVVDTDLCQGHGVCENEAPGVFEVGKNHQVVVLELAPTEDRRAELEAAVRFCPTHALTIADD